MRRIKLIAIFTVLAVVTFIAATSHRFSSAAQTDDVLAKISSYKTWTKVTKEPIKLDFNLDGGG